MSYAIIRTILIDTLSQVYSLMKTCDFSDRLVMSDVLMQTRAVIEDYMLRQLIEDYDVTISFKDPTNESAGYAVDITIWPDASSNYDLFMLFVTPPDEHECDDPIIAYDRAMKIL